MRRRPARGERKRRMCREKARYGTWDAAATDAIHVHSTKGVRANPATPFPCDVCGGYHLGNYVPPLRRVLERWVVTFR